MAVVSARADSRSLKDTKSIIGKVLCCQALRNVMMLVDPSVCIALQMEVKIAQYPNFPC